MTTVVAVPSSLDEFSFEQVADQVARVPADARLLLDARATTWASPFGLCSLLALGETRAERPEFVAPEASETVRYWARAGFFRHGDPLFRFAGPVPSGRGADDSATLLTITRIEAAADIHDVVDGIEDAAQRILTEQLELGPSIAGFMMSLSEACQNVVEHAGRGGWVMAQSYNYRHRQPRRRVVQIAVCDAGIGFKASLGPAHARRFGDRWDDARALEEAVVRAVSRFRDPGRGQGLAGIRRFIGRWEGKLTVRSGTARIGVLPPWDDDVPLQADLPYFPGAQVLITIPAKGNPRAMIHHIDLGSVLRDQVHAGYGNLVTRSTGARVRVCIEERLAALDAETVTVLDFSGVGVLDFSCADEIVAKLSRAAHDGGGARLRFTGVSAGHLEAIEAVLERHGLMLAVEPATEGGAGDAYRVVGAPLA